MLEQLGLGVVLSLEDNFTPQSNQALNSFDRLQRGAEGMVQNVQKQMMSLQNVMLAGFSLSEVGKGIENFGKKMIGSVVGVQKEILKVNASFETIQKQMLTSFGGNAKEAEEAFSWVREFAVKTPFQVENTARALTSLRMTGVDVRKTFKDINGEMKPFLQYLGDLATKNMSASGGMEGMMIAMNNAFSGQWTSLQKRFDIPKSEIDKLKAMSGSTEQLMQGVVDLANKFTPSAMQNLVGTWEETISEMQDVWRNFAYDMGQEGVFDSAKKSLHKLAIAMGQVLNPNLAESLKQAFTVAWKPIDLLVDGVILLAKGLGKLQEKFPVVAQLVITFMTLGGALVMAGGFAMRLSGQFLILFASISSLMLNMKLMALEGITLSGVFAGMGTAVMGFVSKLSVVGLIGTGLYLAWQQNVGGLQTKMGDFFNSVSMGWKMANEAMSKGVNMSSLMKEYSYKTVINIPPLAKIFGEKFLKIIALSKAFWQVITGQFDNGVMYFSQKDWDLYESAGIAGLVRGMVYAREKIDWFFKGFKDGLTIVYDIMKEFVKFVWTPIQGFIDIVNKHIKNNPDGILSSLIIGESGVGIARAKEAQQTAETLGRILGTVLGAFVAFKGINAITSVISKPFKALNSTLTNTIAKLGGVANSMKNLANGGLLSKFGSTKVGKYVNDVGGETRDLVDKYDRTSTHRKGQAYKDGKYQNLFKGDVDDTYYKYFLQDKLGQGQQLQVKRRSSLGRTLFGEEYFARNANGSRDSLGRFGGILNMNRDDRNINNMATSRFARTVSPRDNTVEGLTHRATIGDPVMQLRHMGGAMDALGGQQASYQNSLRGISRSATSLSNSQFNRFSSVRSRAIESDYLGLSNNARTGNISDSEMSRLRQYHSLGYTGGNASQFDRDNFGNSGASGIYNTLRRDRARNAVNNSADYQRIRAQAGASSLNRNVFADSGQGRLSRMMFGQRLYTVNEGADGQFSRETVGRRGGIFRRSSMDNMYNPESSLGSRVADSRLGLATTGLMSRVSSSAVGRGVSRAVGATRSGMGSMMTMGRSGMSRISGALAPSMMAMSGWANRQRERVGLAPRVPRNDGRSMASRAMQGTGRFLFGSKITDAQGNITGRRQGAVSKVGRGAVGAVKGVGRGIGAMGGLAMRAMPWMMLGSMAFSGISNKGANVSKKERQQMGLAGDASNFQVGLKSMQQSVSKMKLDDIWKKFKKEGSACFKIVGDIAKDVFKQLKQHLPMMMKDAWNGIKGLASLAWTWIKTDGIKVMGSIASSTMSLLGKAWNWVSANAGKMLGNILAFGIGKVIPGLVAGVVKLGTFIITHIPQVLQGLLSIALGIFKGIYNGVKEIFSGIASFLYNTISSAFKGLGNVLLGAIAKPIRGIPVIGDQVANALGLPKHHGGLWMSPDEHQAVIRRDETVLPPDMSRKLDKVLKSDDLVTSNKGRGILPPKQDIDQSVKIEKVEIVLQAGKLSQDEARKQAQMILAELKKIKKEKGIRQHKDIGDADFAF